MVSGADNLAGGLLALSDRGAGFRDIDVDAGGGFDYGDRDVPDHG